MLWEQSWPRGRESLLSGGDGDGDREDEDDDGGDNADDGEDDDEVEDGGDADADNPVNPCASKAS